MHIPSIHCHITLAPPPVVVVPMVAHEVSDNMAQTTIPVYLTGKLGSVVYTGNRQGTAVRQLVTPKNPQTAAQTAQRQRFSAAAKAWAGLSAAAQLTWKTFAATLANNLSDFNAFVLLTVETCAARANSLASFNLFNHLTLLTPLVAASPRCEPECHFTDGRRHGSCQHPCLPDPRPRYVQWLPAAHARPCFWRCASSI